MHEYALTKQIVKIISDTAIKHGALSVNAAHLVIGENTSIIPESVQMYYDMIARGTPADGAALHVRIVRTEMHCPVCDRNFVRPRFSFECPCCGALGGPTDIGNEFFVERVEIETPLDGDLP